MKNQESSSYMKRKTAEIIKYVIPHSLYLPSDMLSMKESIMSIFSIQRIRAMVDYISLDFTLIVNLLSWMSNQKYCYTSISFMTQLYTTLFDFMEQDEMVSINTIKIIDMLKNNKPFLWIPDTYISSKRNDEHVTVDDNNNNNNDINGSYKSDDSRNVVMKGSFYSLSHVVKSDPSENFIKLDSIPVKVIRVYYKDMENYFGRKVYCTVCQCAEGMFGVAGHPIKSLCNRRIGLQTCSCIDTGFGKFLPNQSGLVRKSPSLEQLMLLLAFYRDEIKQMDNLTNNQIISHSKKQHGDLSETRKIYMQEIKDILTGISRDIWKCFHIKNSLHPYSADSLNHMKLKFHSEEFLLTINGEFIALSSNVIDDNHDDEGDDDAHRVDYNSYIIAIDDMNAFKAFETDLNLCFLHSDSIYRILWLDGTNTSNEHTTILGHDTDIYESNNHAITDSTNLYDLENLIQDTNNMLNSTEYIFKSAVGYISPMTFFAPKSLLPLFRFLDIPLFSHYVKSDWFLDANAKENIEIYFLINSLLLITQTYLFSKNHIYPNLYQRLQPAERIRKLFQLKILLCDNLYRNISIKLLTFEKNNQIKSYHYYDDSMNVLYLDKNIPKADKHNLFINIIMSIIRVEVAVLEKNQCIELISGLETLLKKMIDKNMNKVSQLFLFRFQLF